MSRARSARPISADSLASDTARKPYMHPSRTVRSAAEIIARMIYFDQSRAAELIEDISSTRQGLSLISYLGGIDAEGVIRQPDRRAVLLRLIDDEMKPALGEVIELRLTDQGLPRGSWEELHPEQPIAITGRVASAKDVQPSSLRLQVGTTSVRVYVERDHFLHLNQSYLTALPIAIVVGKVRSVPRTEMRAAAIGTLPISANGRDTS